MACHVTQKRRMSCEDCDVSGISWPEPSTRWQLQNLRQTSGQNFWWNSSMSTMWRLSDTLWELGSSQFLKQYTDVYSIYIYIFIFISESAVQLTDMVGSEIFVGAKHNAFTVFCTSATGRSHIISWAQTLLLLNVSPSPAFQCHFIRLSQWSE